MAKLSTFALAGALFFALLPVAGHAADLPEPPLLAAPPVEFASAWYLRGDVGYKIYRDPKVSYGGADYRKEKLDDTGVIGGGVGYKVSDWLRVDGTVDYEFKTPFHGELFCPTLACSTLANQYSHEKAKISAITPLANVYVDLGNFHGIMPYIGAGAGASYIMIDDYKYTNPNGTTGSNKGGNDWSFTWALMAGIGYQVTDNLIIDAGYRYLNLGDAKTKNTNGGFNGSKPIKFDNLEAHEFRVGLRYMID